MSKPSLALGAILWLVAAVFASPAVAQLTDQQARMIREAAPNKPTVEPKRPRRVLIWNTPYMEQSPHKGYTIPQGACALRTLGEKTGAFEGVVSNDQTLLLPENLAKFDAMVMNNSCGPWTTPTDESLAEFEALGHGTDKEAIAEKLRASLLDWVREGHGVVAFHYAVGAGKHWPELHDLLGASMGGHPWNEEVGLQVEEPSHPLCAAFEAPKPRLHEEVFQFLEPWSREKVRVLLSLDTTATNMNVQWLRRDDGDYALAWVKPYGAGRVFYSAIGHRTEHWWNPTILRFYADAIQFACGDLDAPASPRVAKDEPKPDKKIPVIYDSDIGSDIDDTWALGMLLARPEFDVKLVVGDYGLTEYRAKLFAKFLERAGRTDIPVGIGMEFPKAGGVNQGPWVEDYDLKSYPGPIREDGVQAIIDTIMNADEPITVIAVGPLPNIAEALKREPRIAERARFVGMHGSVYKGYGGSDKISAEWNVRAEPKSCAAALSAPWDVTITPLDTCGIIQLQGDKYQRVLRSESPIAKAIIENYRIWAKTKDWAKPDTASSTLFDTVAVYLAFDQSLAKMEDLPIRVTDDGFTVIDDKAKTLHVATEWKNLGAFEDLLVDSVCAEK